MNTPEILGIVAGGSWLGCAITGGVVVSKVLRAVQGGSKVAVSLTLTPPAPKPEPAAAPFALNASGTIPAPARIAS